MVSVRRTYETRDTARTKKELGEVSILLDTYDDIFSDFDPSPYAERGLSDDFIHEVKKLLLNKGGNKKILNLLLPANQRNEADEKIIVGRLHHYFSNARDQLAYEVRSIYKRGLVLTFIGSLVMLIASYISFINSRQFYAHVLFVLFEPAGWFFLWAGLDHLVYSSREPKKDLAFYTNMAKAGIHFFNS